MDGLSVLLLQMNVVPGDPAANVSKARALFAGVPAGEGRPDIVVLPELWTAPFDPARSPGRPFPCEGSGEALRAVCGACEEMCVHALAGALPWPVKNGVAVRSWLVDDSGTCVDYYDKAHLFSASGESRTFVPGAAPLFFELGGFRCSVMTCYDIRFPEFGRSLALCGAEVIFVLAAWLTRRADFWKPLLRALAMHNQCYVAACNCAGQSGDQNFCGNSMVVSPWGDVLLEAGGAEGVLFGVLSRSEVYKCRKYIPISSDRRPDLYQIF